MGIPCSSTFTLASPCYSYICIASVHLDNSRHRDIHHPSGRVTNSAQVCSSREGKEGDPYLPTMRLCVACLLEKEKQRKRQLAHSWTFIDPRPQTSSLQPPLALSAQYVRKVSKSASRRSNSSSSPGGGGLQGAKRPGSLGKSVASRILFRPRKNCTMRFKPNPPPPCGLQPHLKASV